MASPSSPTSSTYSSPDFGAPSSDSAVLPISALRDKIIEKIQENRVTLIVGEPGCGKSSQVPQFLLEENMEPILCTQPRRFAVVAVANMVAKARNCEVGEEIGYHIGHSKVFSERSKILFKTAGVLLDEIRDKGLRALKYKVIILDEVHERSVESDLVLLCVKQFLLKNSSLRLVLMSATADINKYRDYFRDLGRGERVEVLAVPPSTNQHQIFQRKVLYLEQVTELLDMESESLSTKYCSGLSPFAADAGIKANVHKLIHELVVHIHRNEPDMEKSILIFLPTYYSLEQQWFLLKPFSRTFKVFILHRSVNTAEALKAMKILKSHRKVILATNIAESSVTIPQVGYVIDSCRSLQVFWDNNRKLDSAELVWVSRSQADQRKGRTGRTCDGYVYRLVTRSFFNQLEEYEPPAILKLSLRQQVLLLCCSDSRAINDPKALLQKALDPPDHQVVEDALDLLVRAHALERRSPRGRNEPTFYGQLLASFGLSFDASVLILKFGDLGLLREGILIGILMDLLPLPIVRPFGQGNLHMEYTSNFYAGDSRITGLTGKKEVFHMGNFCAFQFWQLVFKDKYRLEKLKQLSKSDGAADETIVLHKIEEEWCTFHNLLQSALHEVAETYDEIVNSLHRFRPKTLLNSNSLPLYYDTREYQHTCFLKDDQSEDEDTSYTNDNHLALDTGVKACAAVPFVSFNDFRTSEVAEKLATIVKEMRVMLTDAVSGNNAKSDVGSDSFGVTETPLCIYFLKGFCSRGSQCMYAHSFAGKRPHCMFVYSLQGCRNGESCPYSHDISTPSSITVESSCLPEDDVANPHSLIQLFPDSPEGCVLLMDDADFHFSLNLASFIDSSSMIITNPSQRGATAVDPLLMDAKILWGLSHPVEAIVHKAGEELVPWNKVECILWFPQFDSEILEVQKGHLKNVFQYLSLRMLADALFEVQLIITMNNIRFSQLQVML
ncbi:OLC1v1004355C4 [Oldenlandia corymbosa var. corymbosa]|uniref:RNA helicase n=1 Tax=Oldenlandia corymbosa var. corymbosa TaxID=529605 RepID=A0AAV1DFJ7_OLDCO|nr:OLC1v1004355C4 [Oldenlandia corymbosa var. corymbosa]